MQLVEIVESLYLLDALELDEQDDGVDLVLVQPLHRLQVHVQHAVLALNFESKREYKVCFFLKMLASTYPLADLLDGLHGSALVVRSPTPEKYTLFPDF